MKSMGILVFACLVISAVAKASSNVRRQMPHGVNAERRIDGSVVFGASNDIDRNNVVKTQSGVEEVEDENLDLPVAIGDLQALNRLEEITEEPSLIDSFLGDGAQSRIVSTFNGWVLQKARNNPGCVERFVCETYRTGETLTGIPYVLMSVTNAAVSFMVADTFGTSVDIQEISRAARHGRTVGSCHTMKCDLMDGQLRTLGDYLGTVEEFLSSMYNSIANSMNLGKK